MPKYAEERALSIINNSILAVAVIVCVAFFIKIYVSMQGTINDGWWKPVAVCGSMLIISGFTFFGMLIRNFWIFKAPKRPGGF